MKSVDEIKNRIQELQEQKDFFKSLSPDIQAVDLNISRVNLINEQINLLKWIIDELK